MTATRHIPLLFVISILCVHTSSGTEADMSDKEVRATAEPIITTILEGYAAQDYARYSLYFSDGLKRAITELKFKSLRKQIHDALGDPESHTYLGFLHKNNAIVVLWKARFSKAKDDVLIRLVMSKEGDKFIVSGVWFQ